MSVLHCGAQHEIKKANEILLTLPPRNIHVWKHSLGYGVLKAETGHSQASLSEAVASVQQVGLQKINLYLVS